MRRIINREGKLISDDNKVKGRRKQHFRDMLEVVAVNEEETGTGAPNITIKSEEGSDLNLKK